MLNTLSALLRQCRFIQRHLLTLTVVLNGLTMATAQTEYAVPTVPDSITDVTRRADYVVTHYWERYDFGDTTLLHRELYAEQALSNFAAIAAYASADAQATGVRRWLDAAATSAATYRQMTTLAEEYLYDMHSPVHNDTLYTLVTQHMLTSPTADEAMRGRALFQQRLLQRNAIGTTAEDFSYETADGRRHNLLGDTAPTPMTLLLFYDPDCRQCRDLLFRLRFNSALQQAVESGRLTVIAVYTEGDEPLWKATRGDLPETWTTAIDRTGINDAALYDLRQLPVMYLLDAQKRVLQRPADIYQLTERLLQ